LLPEFDAPVRLVLAIAIIGIAGYLAFLLTIDVPMYLTRWRAEVADGSKLLKPLEGLHDVSTRWVVTHDLAEPANEFCNFGVLRADFEARNRCIAAAYREIPCANQQGNILTNRETKS
jgi:hypothetical protein